MVQSTWLKVSITLAALAFGGVALYTGCTKITSADCRLSCQKQLEAKCPNDSQQACETQCNVALDRVSSQCKFKADLLNNCQQKANYSCNAGTGTTATCKREQEELDACLQPPPPSDNDANVTSEAGDETSVPFDDAGDDAAPETGM